MPNCSQISVGTGGNLSVPGGSVRAVTGGLAFTQRAVASTNRLELYVSASSGGSGNQTGQDAYNETPIGSAVSLWTALLPRLTIFYLDSGTGSFSLASSLDPEASHTFGLSENSSLVIGTNPTQTTPASLLLGSALSLKTNTTFQNLSLDTAGVAISAYKPLTFRNVTSINTNVSLINAYDNVTIIDSTLKNIGLFGFGSNIVFNHYSGTSSSLSTGYISAQGGTLGFYGGGGYSITSLSTGGARNISLHGASLMVTSGSSLTSTSNNGTAAVYADAGSNVYVDSGTTLTTSSSGSSDGAPIWLNNAALTLNGTLGTSGAGYGMLTSNSSMNIGSGTATLTGTSYGLVAYNSSISVNGNGNCKTNRRWNWGCRIVG